MSSGVGVRGREECVLCRSDLAPILGEEPYWRVVLNINQNLLGKSMLVLRRHEEPVTQLGSDEWAALHEHLARLTRALQTLFEPDHFNYAFLQNQDRHVHLHVIPRYAAARHWQGQRFEDPDYPAHYAVPSAPKRLSAPLFDRLAAEVRSAYQQAAPKA